MASPVRPMLPPLHDAHRVPPIPQAGTWHPLGSADPLQVIARGLNTGRLPGDQANGPAGNRSGNQVGDQAGEIVSVPDIWAQLTVFHNALEAENHPLHSRTVAEWRGLLACFALGAYRTPDLTSEVVSVRPRACGSRWNELVGRLPPQCPLLDGGRLEEVALVRAGGQLVAIAQALTLVAPSRSLADHRHARPPVPWMQNGRFQDPLLVAGLSGEERAVLARFLDKLCTDLDAELGRRRGVGALLGHARKFLEAARLGAASVAPSRFEPEPAALGLPAHPIFAALRMRERVGMAPGQGAASDCLLRLRPGLEGSALRGIVLVDLDMHEQLGRPAGEIRVWERFSLRMLQEKPENLAQIKAGAQAAGYLVVEAAELFLPKLYCADGVEGEQGFEQHSPSARRHLLPLSPLLLAVAGRGELARACRMAAAGAGGTTVNLRLPMADGSDVTFSRHYATEEAIEPPFTLSVWPNFQADWWRLHLGYSGATPSIQFVVAGFASLQGFARCLSATTDGFSAVTVARALLGGNVAALADTTWFRADRQAAKALYALPGAAEAAVLEDRRGGAPRIAGLLLLPEPAAVAIGSGGVAKVGIDFGTTNTAVYIQVGAQEPEPLRMEPRHILAYRMAEQSRDELDAELLPVSQIDVPFQTILRDRMLASTDRERRPFRDTLIYFAQRRKAALERVAGKDDDLFANLKWGDDQPSRERVELFLAQVVMMALVEAAGRGIEPGQVSFRFSFPEAFRRQQRLSFQAAARNAVSRGLRTVAAAYAGQAEPRFQSESVATAQYFIHRLQRPPTEGLITFDIGGQTTDVAVVQSQSLGAERLIWRGSFQLAGRHLLIEHLRENRGVLDQLARGRPELSDLLRSLNAAGQASMDRRTLATELLVNSAAFAEAFDQVLPTLAGMQEAEQLRAVALAGLAGLFDYIGRTIRRLAEAGRVETRSNTSVSVCLGGRASLLYRTLLRSEDEQALALGFLTAAAGEAMPRARLVFSEAPKQEVAYGLVRDDQSLLGGIDSEPLLGESVTCAGGSTPATGLVSQLDITQAWRIEDPAEFRRFVRRLPELRIKSALPETALGDMAGLANAELARALRLAQQERAPGELAADGAALEPPFIVLLRQFVHRLATDPGAVRA